jgi:hypothetical protein
VIAVLYENGVRVDSVGVSGTTALDLHAIFAPITGPRAGLGWNTVELSAGKMTHDINGVSEV